MQKIKRYGSEILIDRVEERIKIFFIKFVLIKWYEDKLGFVQHHMQGLLLGDKGTEAGVCSTK
jgi:hypothetical protein